MSTWLVEKTAKLLGSRSTRRRFLTRTAVVGSALATNPVTYLLRPGTAYAAVCSCSGQSCTCGSACCDGYTEFCCAVNQGRNSCPPGSFPAGWWKADGSRFCSGPRYYIDCNAACSNCSSGCGPFCTAACDSTECSCALGDCNRRASGCRRFRYGQCHQEISCVGRIVCRLVSCTPAWIIDSTCTTSALTDNNTRDHTTVCAPTVLVREVLLRSDGVSGWTLDGSGRFSPFGGAPAITSGPTFNQDIVRGAVLRDDTSGYVLDGYGGLHPFGGAPSVNHPYWPGFDIARDVTLGPDGVSGYVLDGYGGLHAFGGAPAPGGGAYWSGWDIARAVALRPDGVSGYVLDGYGGLHAFGGAPPPEGGPYFAGRDIARDVVISFDGASGYVLDALGGVHRFGAARPVGTSPSAVTSTPTARRMALHPNAVSGAVVDEAGAIRHFGSADVLREVVPRPGGTGAHLLTGWGSVVSDGGAAAISGGPSWPGWDIARDLVMVGPDSGYVLDGLGGLHTLGAAETLTGLPRFSFDIARALLLGSSTSGYVLDGYGGLHPFGGAPTVTDGPYWAGWDVARGATLRSDGESGWVLDAFGGVHAFGGAPAVTAPFYLAGADLARAIVALDDSSGYVLDAFGGVHPFGGAPDAVTTATWSWWQPARSLALRSANPIRGVVLDAYGGLHGFAGSA